MLSPSFFPSSQIVTTSAVTSSGTAVPGELHAIPQTRECFSESQKITPAKTASTPPHITHISTIFKSRPVCTANSCKLPRQQKAHQPRAQAVSPLVPGRIRPCAANFLAQPDG